MAAGTSRQWMMRAVEASLRRLGTGYIDIYYLHKEDHATPLDETVRAMGDLMRQGKIRYFGVSNYRAWRVAEICKLCDQMGIGRPVVSQPYYHALNRTLETRAPAGLRLLWPRRVQLLAARARHPDRQIRPGRAAAGRQPRRAGGQADAADRVAPALAASGREIAHHAAATGRTPTAFAVHGC